MTQMQILKSTQTLRWHEREFLMIAIKILVFQFPDLSAWSMVKSINVLSCFIKILSTSNNSLEQAHWNSGQTEKVHFLHSIILSVHSLCCFHLRSFFKISLCFISHFSHFYFFFLALPAPLHLCRSRSPFIPLSVWIHMFQNSLPYLIAS